MSDSIYRQAGYDVRFEWGQSGAAKLAPDSGVLIVVDVLRFTTAIDVAVGCGATVYPHPQEGAEAYARQHGALLAVRTQDTSVDHPYSLSPGSLAGLPAGSRLVLPSLNGSAIASAHRGGVLLAGCLRNASAVANAARQRGGTVTVIAAGEWFEHARGPRFAIEDLIGAGAILAAIGGSPSPEAHAAIAVFHATRARLLEILRTCVSGRELIGWGFGSDVDVAAQNDVSMTVPELREGEFVNAS